MHLPGFIIDGKVLLNDADGFFVVDDYGCILFLFSIDNQFQRIEQFSCIAS